MEDRFAAELAAMQEVGTRRSRARLLVVVAAFAGCCVALWCLRYVIGLYIGALFIAVISAPVAAGIAVAVVQQLTPGIIRAVAEKHGVPVDKLSQSEFIVN